MKELNELRFVCDYCGEKFSNRDACDKHEKECRRKHEEQDTRHRMWENVVNAVNEYNKKFPNEKLHLYLERRHAEAESFNDWFDRVFG